MSHLHLVCVHAQMKNSTENQKLRCIELLVNAGVDVNYLDHSQYTVLHRAAELHFNRILCYLCEYTKINKLLKNEKNQTAE